MLDKNESQTTKKWSKVH